MNQYVTGAVIKELAEYFIRRAAEEGSELRIITNMFAYDCLDLVRPDTEADGGIHCCV